MTKKTKYIVLCGQVIGGRDQPFTVEYDFDGTTFSNRQEAIKHGLIICESDDFNIGVVEGKKLVSLDWMNEPVDTDPKILAKIAGQIDL